MSVLKKLTGLVMAVALLFTMAPRTVMAEGDGPEPKAVCITEIRAERTDGENK